MNKFKNYLLLAGLLGVVVSHVLAVSVIRVPQDASTIQAAVDRARMGDLILVSPQIYRESVVIKKSGISLMADVPPDAFTRSLSERAVLDGDTVLETGIYVLGTPDEPVRDVLIRGFFVRRYARGIVLENVERSRVELNETSDGLDLSKTRSPSFPNGIDLIGSSFNSIVSNFTHDNAHDGIRITDLPVLPPASVRGSDFNIVQGNIAVRNHPPADARPDFEHIGCGVDLVNSSYNMVVGNEVEETDWGIGIFEYSEGNVVQQNSVHSNHRAGIPVLEPAHENVITDNDATGNGLLDLPPTGRFDLFDAPPRNNTWFQNNKGTFNFPIPLATGVRFDPASVRVGGSFTVTLSGENLTAQTYFDARFRRPGSTTDEVSMNWQQGISAPHTAAGDIPLGIYTLTDVRAHEDLDDHTGPFAPISATVTVNP